MLWILLTLAQGAAPVSFYPGAGDSKVTIENGAILGVPVQLTGTVVAHASNPEALGSLPGVRAVRQLRGPVVELTLETGVEPAGMSVALRDRPDVRWAHPDLIRELKPRYVPNDRYYGDQWHLQNTGQLGYTPGADMNLEEAWDLATGAGQIISIIDTGIDQAHPDIDTIVGFDYVGQDNDSQPPGWDPHGTACAGLAAGIGDNGEGIAGVAYDAQAYSIRLIGYTSMADMYDAFVESVDAGASVLSNSWGYDDGCSAISGYGIVEDSMAYAEQNGRNGLGSIVVFSAGNGNCDIEDDGMQAVPTVVSVAASNGYDVKEGYSSFGRWVDITAPSGNIVTADITGSDGYNGVSGDDDYTDWFSGTSASAPMVAGVYALMFSANDRLTAQQARDAMCATAVRIDLLDGQYDDAGWSPFYGCGRVDAGAAVRAVYNEGPPEIPVVTGPPAEVEAGRVVLEWAPALDPDDDRLAYKVRYWYPDYPDAKKTTIDTERPWLQLPDEAVAPGTRIAWKVQASDAWGAGEWTADQTFEILTPPPEDEQSGGCTTAPATVGGLWFLALVATRRR